MINTKIVCNPQCPREKFTLVSIATRTKCINDLDEYLLKNIFGKASVFYKDNNGGEYPVLVLFDQLLQCIGIAIDKKRNELLVSQVDRGFHVMVFLDL
jgi:hypothetical protein